MNETKTIAEQVADVKPTTKPKQDAKPAPKPHDGIPIRALYFKTGRDIGPHEQGLSRIISGLKRPDKPIYTIRLVPGPMFHVRSYKPTANIETDPPEREFLLGFDEGTTAEVEPRS